MAFSVDRSLAGAKSIPALALLLQKLFVDLEDFLNQTPALQSDTGGGFERERLGDLLVTKADVTGNFVLSYVVGENAKISVTIGPAVTDINAHYKGLIINTGSPSLTHFPESDSWGFFWNGAAMWLVFNRGGSLLKTVSLT